MENALSAVAEGIKEAQAAAVSLYCSRVHQVPLECMGRAKRAEIYSRFGVYHYGSSLKSPGSEDGSMRPAFERFTEKVRELFDSIDKMTKGAQIKVLPIGKSEDEEEALYHH